MNDFAVIPAIDLKGGPVVHASGEKQPACRPWTPLVRRRCDRHRRAFSPRRAALYVGDLDAIEGVAIRSSSAAIFDALRTRRCGSMPLSNVTNCAFWLPLGATLVRRRL